MHRLRRLVHAPLGPFPLSRQAETQALSNAADAFFAVSLAGSLFFNVSVEAARPRVILYLVVTMAPFAVVASLVGPVIDRVRGGHRLVVALTCAARAVVALGMADNLRSLLLYPQAFVVLVLGKTYSVAKSALVPRLVEDAEELVEANSRLSRVGTIGGAVGGAVAVGILNLADAAWVLRAGSAVYVLAALAALRLPRLRPTPPVWRALEYEELHAPRLLLAAGAMGVLRAAVGFLFFLLAFALKREGDPTWFFGAVFAAAGGGGLIGTFVAPRARRVVSEERLLMLALAVPAALVSLAALSVGRATTLMAAWGLGIGANAGRQAFDALVQREAPDADRGRMFARFETRFQLSWVVGAIVPVLARPPLLPGLAALGASLAVGAASYATGGRAFQLQRLRAAARAGVRAGVRVSGWPPGRDRGRPEQRPLALEILETARRVEAEGAHRQAIVHAATAAEVAGVVAATDGPGWERLQALRVEAVAGNAAIGRSEADEAIALAAEIVGARWPL